MADDTEIKIGLSPEEILAALKQISDATKNLEKTMQDSLGKNASQAVNDLKDNAEKGTNQITKFFSNMGTRIKEDLKTAFDVQSIMAGANFAKQIGEGVKSIFDMERAFDRLGVRMNLTTSQMENFKRSAGRAAAANGVNLQDIQPGLMSAAANGVKDPAQLTMITASLAKARQIDPSVGTGEGITDSIFEIMRRQGLEKNGTNYGSTMDAINSATATGNFKGSTDAASHISALAQYSSTNGMDTRSLAGLAAVASQGGQSSQALLNQILEAGGGHDKGAALNATLGQDVFKNGKLDPAALAKVDTKQFGSESILGEASGLSGANGGDLKILIDTFQKNMGSFQQVVNGTNETAEQFDKVSKSWAYQTEKFKTNLTESGRELGDSLIETATDIFSGKGYKTGAGHIGSAITDNAGTLAGGLGLGVGASLLMGGGVRGLFGSAAASAAGVNKVYVTNAAEISGPLTGGLSGALGLKGKLGKWGDTSVGDFYSGDKTPGGVGGKLAAAGSVLMAAAIGYEIGKVLLSLFPSLGTKGGDAVYDLTHNDAKTMANAERSQLEKNKKDFDARNGTNETMEQYAKAVKDGTLAALKEHNAGQPKVMTKPTPNYPERQ